MGSLTIFLFEEKVTGFSIWMPGKKTEREIEVVKAERGYTVRLTISEEIRALREPLNTHVLSKYAITARKLLSHLARLGFREGISALNGIDIAYISPTQVDGEKLHLKNGKIVTEKHTWSTEHVPKGWEVHATGKKTVNRQELEKLLKGEFSLSEEEVSALFSIIGRSKDQVRRRVRGIKPIENGIMIEDFSGKIVVVRLKEGLYLFAKYTLRETESIRKKLSRFVGTVLTIPDIDIRQIRNTANVRQTINGKGFATELPAASSFTVIAAGKISQKKLREFLAKEQFTKSEINNVIDYILGRGSLSLPFSGYRVRFSFRVLHP